MKYRGLAYILLIILLLGCQKEDDDPSADPSGNPSEDPTEEPITAATVGPAGGVLRNEQINITIPPGSFDTDEDLNLTELTDLGCFHENSVSTRYLIEGLPDSFDKPLKVEIAYHGELKGESFLVAGEETVDLETGESSTYYEFISGIDSSGYLIFEFPG